MREGNGEGGFFNAKTRRREAGKAFLTIHACFPLRLRAFALKNRF
jgi:hypothetical protein